MVEVEVVVVVVVVAVCLRVEWVILFLMSLVGWVGWLHWYGGCRGTRLEVKSWWEKVVWGVKIG